MYSSINNSKIYPKLTKPIDRMGQIQTAYLLCTRITLETTALRVTWKLRSRRTGVFPEVQVCVFECFWCCRRVFQICEKSCFFTTSGSKQIVHEPNPLFTPYSAHMLWKIMIFWPTESSRRILCGKNCVQIMYSSINNSKIYPKLTKPTDRMGRIRTAYLLLCIRITLETTALRVT